MERKESIILFILKYLSNINSPKPIAISIKKSEQLIFIYEYLIFLIYLNLRSF